MEHRDNRIGGGRPATRVQEGARMRTGGFTVPRVATTGASIGPATRVGEVAKMRTSGPVPRISTGESIGPATPFRKVPGPASKTLMRTSASPMTSKDGNRVQTVGRKQSYASVVFGGGAAPGPAHSTANGVVPKATAATAIRKSSSAKTHCSFCTDPVVIAIRGGNSGKNPKELCQLVGTLCHKMQLDKKQLPKVYSQTAFPFCSPCIEILEELDEYQKIIDDANGKMVNIVNKIERIVVDSEILNGGHQQPMTSLAGMLEQQRCSMLRTMMLQVIRKNLLMKQELRQSNCAKKQFLGLDPPQQEEMPRNEFPSAGASFNSTSLMSGLETTQEVENLPMDIDGSNNPSVENLVNVEVSFLQDEEEAQDEDEQNISAQEDLPLQLPPNADYVDKRCTVAIATATNVKRGKKAPIVKQEIMDASSDDEPESDEIENETETNENESNESPRPHSNDNGIKTRIRSGSLIRKRFHEDFDEEERKRGPPRKKLRRTSTPLKVKGLKRFSCSTCMEEFPHAEALKTHKSTHSVHVCNICGRAVKGSYNLMTQRFTHKNDKEREAAVAAGEPGTNKVRLSNKLNNQSVRKP